MAASSFFCSLPTLGGCVEVPGLSIAQKVIFIVGKATEEEGTADQDNRGRPPKTIGPIIDVSDGRVGMKVEGLGVLHGVNYQGDDLEDSSQGQEASNHSQKDKHLGSTEGKEGEDETDHQDDKATEEHGSGCPSPRVLHEALAAILVGPAAAALVEASPPQGGRLDVFARLQPAAAGQRDDVEGDGAEQQQGQDPPAALAGQAAAQHLDGGGAEERSARGSVAGGEWPASAGSATKGKRPRGGGSRRTRLGAPGPHLDSGDSRRAAPTCPAGRGARGERRGRARVTPGVGEPGPPAPPWSRGGPAPGLGRGPGEGWGVPAAAPRASAPPHCPVPRPP